MEAMAYQDFEELREAFPELKRSKRLHSVVEERLAKLLSDIYSEGHPKREPGEIPGGRSDLAFYFPDGRYAVFEIFATKSQVDLDLRHLERSGAQARIAILTDPSLDNAAIFDEYFRKKPREPFPWLKLSDILVIQNEATAKEKLKRYIDEAYASDEDRETTARSPELRLRLYRMGRDQTQGNEISFETHRSLPQHHQFGFALENTSESTMAKGIYIRVEISWRGHDLAKSPSLQAPRYQGWTTQVSQLVCEQPAVLTFRDTDLSCFYGQPIEWDNVRLTLPERMRGHLLVQYRVSSTEPFTDNAGELRIVLGDE